MRQAPADVCLHCWWAWRPAALPAPLCSDKPVIRKALVDLEGPVMRAFSAARASWAAADHFRVPGPIQAGSAGSAC